MAAKVKKQKEHRFRFTREELFHEYFEDMNCLACVSTLQSYQFVHTLNMLLDKNFRFDMVEMTDAAGVGYKVYSDKDPIRNIDYTIICNRYRTEFLIPELPNTDFLILMNGMRTHPDILAEVLDLLKKEKRISYTYDFDPMKLKSKEYLIL